jgi:FkbM family methyltransferase
MADAFWRIGARIFRAVKRIGFLSPLQHALLRVANNLISPLSSEVNVSLPGGQVITLPPNLPRARTYLAGLYEREVTSLIQVLLPTGGTFVDVGAFCGYYVVLASWLVGPEGLVFAFEPSPHNFSYLKFNIAANCCRNVYAVNEAVESCVRTTHLVIHHEADHCWTTQSALRGEYVNVRSTSLDAFFAARYWPSVDLVKIDVEGGELEVLRGMAQLSLRNPQMNVIMEFDRFNLRRAGARPADIESTVRELGFRTGYVIERGMAAFRVGDGLPNLRGTYNLLLTKADRLELNVERAREIHGGIPGVWPQGRRT